MRSSLTSIVLLFVGGLIGSVGFSPANAARQYRLQKGQSFWINAGEQWKTAYLLGYLDAETIYRSNMDLKLKRLCTTSGQKWVNDFDYGFPLIEPPVTVADLQKGLDNFYRNDHAIGMFPAQRIVRLKLAGRSQSEIDAAEREDQIGSALK